MIDEFQDISRSRIELVSQIRDATNAKICVVGDDWQAIYSYAGADINLFTTFVSKSSIINAITMTAKQKFYFFGYFYFTGQVERGDL